MRHDPASPDPLHRLLDKARFSLDPWGRGSVLLVTGKVVLTRLIAYQLLLTSRLMAPFGQVRWQGASSRGSRRPEGVGFLSSVWHNQANKKPPERQLRGFQPVRRVKRQTRHNSALVL